MSEKYHIFATMYLKCLSLREMLIMGKKSAWIAPIKLKEEPSFKQVMESIRKGRKNETKSKRGVQKSSARHGKSGNTGRNDGK